MKTYYITSPKFDGEIELKYNEYEYLTYYDNRAGLNDGQMRWFLSNIPRTLAGLDDFNAKFKDVKVIELLKEITFAMFWDKYDDKSVSNKKKTQKTWDSMDKTEQAKAYHYISTYFALLPKGTRKKYAETYLNSELWNN